MPEIVFDERLKGFLDHLRVERGLSENSISAYQRDLKRFGEFLQSSGLALSSLGGTNVVEYQKSLRVNGLSDSSVNRAMSTLRTYFSYLFKEYGVANPTDEIEKSRQVRRLPKALTVQEIVLLIESAGREGDPISLRNRALLELLYGTGGRVSEIIGLDSSDIHSVEMNGMAIESVKLRGKGGKERLVPLGSFASAALNEYLVRTRPMLTQASTKTTSALFLNQRGSRLSRQSAWKFVLEAAESAGVASKVSPHVFRHSFATHLLDGGADIRVVQELLGHASVTTTQIYTLVTIDKVRESYASAHPRARD